MLKKKQTGNLLMCQEEHTGSKVAACYFFNVAKRNKMLEVLDVVCFSQFFSFKLLIEKLLFINFNILTQISISYTKNQERGLAYQYSISTCL